MTESVPPQPWASMNGGVSTAGGQDFVLFDDATSAAMSTAAGASSSGLVVAQQPMPFAAITPHSNNNSMSTPRSGGAFTEYRNTAQPPGAPSGGGSLNESPFSSPASRPSDDFSSGSMGRPTAIPIAAPQAPGSGTLSQGAPKSKRARAHGYSSSWTGGSLEKYMQQLQQASSGQAQSGGSVSMMPTTSFGGFPTATSGSDWSGSDTSPRNPPSGSFGPPIHSLSLGDNGPAEMATTFSNGQLATLFPSSSTGGGGGGGGGGVFTPLQTTMQQQQEDRARQQIRADLMGVDSRALKGQLRDIQQGSTSTSFPSFDTMSTQSNILFPNVPQTPLGGGMVSPQGNLYDSTAAPVVSGDSTASTQLAAGMTTTAQNLASGSSQQRPVEPAPQPTRQLSERTQQAVNRARAQKPTRKRMTRDYSSTTVSPQEAFLDFQDVDTAMRSSRPADAAPNIFASNTATASIPAMHNIAKSSSSLAGMMAPAYAGGMTTPRATADPTMHEGTPSLVDAGSSGSNSRATSSIPSPSQRAPLNRGETVRPTQAQQDAARASVQRGGNTSFAQADLGMLSPADSATNSTDDEDEKPYAPTRQMKDAPGVSAAQANGMRQSVAPTFGMQQHGGGGGPRFSVVSSSSSESEDEDQKRGGNRKATSSQAMMGATSARPRTMGGYGYMGSSEESGLTIATPSAPPPPSSQQLTSLGMHAMPGAGAPIGMVGGMPGPYGMQVPAMFMPPNLDTSATQNAASHPLGQRQPSISDAPSETGSQSQDEGPRISPSIRSSAQAIFPMQAGGNGQAMPTNMFGMHAVHPSAVAAQQHVPLHPANAAAYAAQYASHQASQARARAASHDASSSTTGATRRGKARGTGGKTASRKKSADDGEQVDDDDDEDDDESSDEWDASADESEGSAYQATAAAATHPKAAKARKSGGSAAAAQRRRSLAEVSGDSASSAIGSALTRCDYVHPLTGDVCGTEFHRPYDLARHRETIHAREESSMLKEGKMTREQCIVLYKEVDPAKSLATVEWRCDGEDGCGALFSRKDALLRHRRIRNH